MMFIKKILLVSGTCLLAGGLLCAQAPPGPLTPPPPDPNAPAPAPPPKKPEVQPRKNILGLWKFNKDESDDGRAKLQQSRQADNTNRGNGGGGYGGPRIGGPWPGTGGGGYGGPRPQSDISDSMGDLVNPPHEMRLSQKFDNDPEVLLADDREHRTSFFTDGRKIEKSKDYDTKQVAARWDDKKLVTDEKGAHGGKVARTFELSSDGKQLIETVHVTDSKGNHPVNVQYVYDAMDQADPYSPH
ncbi:MAG TPA: hypothetical protein VEJ47_08970 [Candidatus Eremiobacteraceae bacterium]|nr:hypothetical protein [Candidatus Eremiobacteraceae bacterium]